MEVAVRGAVAGARYITVKSGRGKPKPFSPKRATESEIDIKLRDVIIIMFTFLN